MKDKMLIHKNSLTLLKCLLISYILTGILLLLLAFLLYRLRLSENIVSVSVIVIYVAVTFVAGFIMGKKIEKRKFLWGVFAGAAYFLILILVSLLINHSIGDVAGDFVTTFLLCAGSGMLGGMLS